MALQTREATSAGFSRLRNQEAVRMLWFVRRRWLWVYWHWRAGRPSHWFRLLRHLRRGKGNRYGCWWGPERANWVSRVPQYYQQQRSEWEAVEDLWVFQEDDCWEFWWGRRWGERRRGRRRVEVKGERAGEEKGREETIGVV